MQSVSIIGIGRVGGALAFALSGRGYSVKKVFSRSPGNAERVAEKIGGVSLRSPGDFSKISEEIIFITTQDSEIPTVAEGLLDQLKTDGHYIFHTSGSLSSAVLEKLSRNGNKVGSIHPLTSISEPALGAKRFKDAYFCVEGDAEAVVLAKQLVSDLDGKPFSIPVDKKALYHASAVTACGHFVALIEVATEMLSNCGMESTQAKEILMPLVESTVSNLKEQSFEKAITGTFARGDVATLERHLESFDGNVSTELTELYLSLGKRSLEIAVKGGLDPKNVSEMIAAMEVATDNLDNGTRNQSEDTVEE